LTFWAADPRTFGESRTFGPVATATSVATYHYGNFPATPVFTVAGSSPGGYEVQGQGGRRYIVTRPLAHGDPHIIDLATGLLRVGGAVVYGGVSRADSWA